MLHQSVYLLTVKEGELAINNQIFLLGQLIVATNQPKDIKKYVCEKNEVKLIFSLYNQATGEFLGLDKQLAYIILRGDDMKCFFSYGYNEKKSKVLYSSAKDRIPNEIISACFKKHFYEIMNGRQEYEEISGVFFISLRSQTERRR